MPQNVFYEVADQVGASYNPWLGVYEFDCSVLQTGGLPSMIFTIGEYEYIVPSTEYVIKVSMVKWSVWGIDQCNQN
ncbi:unnamed protein product [Gongylonema pulchrum]|uniref:Peptidase A1 domain-containing protein n=1 Tax=Gongylonema pulchrum TaxID=637853 RepID=A0A183DAR8_9BILA|nr:unnamed protein product [Gongylonema pulchrum]